MQDQEIISLYIARDEQALEETAANYGSGLLRLARRIVEEQDAEECVNDTYLSAWNSIPPTVPQYFFAWLTKVCRNHAFGRIRWEQAGKRKAEIVEFTQEMAECIPDNRREQEMEDEEIGRVLSAFLRSLPKDKRVMFMRRYWFGDSIREIAEVYGYSESKVKTTLHRVRHLLQMYLAQENIPL